MRRLVPSTVLLAVAACSSPTESDEDAQRADEERLRQVTQEEALLASGVLPADGGSLLVRADFSDEGRWAALEAALDTPRRRVSVRTRARSSTSGGTGD